MKFLLYEIIPRAGFNLATGRFWPAGRIFVTPAVEIVRYRFQWKRSGVLTSTALLEQLTKA